MSVDISPPPLKRRRVESPDQELAKETLSIYSWNINGIDPFIQHSITSFLTPKPKSVQDDDGNDRTVPPPIPPPKASLRDFLRRHKRPTLLLLQEVKIKADDKATIRAIQKAINTTSTSRSGPEPEYTAHFCLPRTAHHRHRKIYGVCTLIRSDFHHAHVSSFGTVDWDSEGRFLILETHPIGSLPRLAIVNVYAVNGTDLSYRDPVSGEDKGTRHERKREVHRLLQKEVRELEARGFAVVLAGDMNVARTALDGFPALRTWPEAHCCNREHFEASFLSPTAVIRKNEDGSEGKATEGLGMVDTFRHLHPTRRGYTYYPRDVEFGATCDRVDMVLVSSILAGSLVTAGMLETPGERGPSDHVPLFAQFATTDPDR